MYKAENQFYEFGPFRLDTVKRQLLQDGVLVPLTPKALDLLLALIQRRDKVLEKDELMTILWPDTIVEEANLSVNMSAVRKALGESPSEHRYIVTIPGRGYRFVAEVHEAWKDPVNLAESSRVQTRVGSQGEAVSFPDVPDREATKLPENRWFAHHGWRNPYGVILILLVFGITAMTVYLWMSASKPAVGRRHARTIAVLPFKPLDAVEGDDYLGLGMADTLINRLSRINQIVVRPTSAVRKFTGVNEDAVAAGRELRVDAVLDGSLQRVNERIRVTVRLVRVEDGVPLWAGKFDERFTDLFAVQDSIAERVAGALTLTLTGEERRLLTKHYTENTEAYQHYLKGRYYWNKRTPEGLKRGSEYFKQAIELDPNYASAYSGLADSYSLLAIQEVLLPKEAFPQARAAALKALEIDGTLAEAQASLAHIRLHEWNWSEAERGFNRAIELSPNYPLAHHWYSEYLAAMGQTDRAIAEERRAEELDPLSLVISTDVAWHLYFGRRYEEAIEQLRKTVDLDTNFALARLRLGQIYALKARYHEANAEILRASELARDSTEVAAALGHAYAVSGRKDEALRQLEELQRPDRKYVSAYFIANVYLGLGDKDQTFAWLDKAYQDRSGWLVFLGVEPRFDSVRSDPRFTRLLHGIGLAN